jgi:hypothetical protein
MKTCCACERPCTKEEKKKPFGKIVAARDDRNRKDALQGFLELRKCSKQGKQKPRTTADTKLEKKKKTPPGI